jgi:bisphosphoglycerate-independent phosphoglycerate mutase (AlkP superfamily)
VWSVFSACDGHGTNANRLQHAKQTHLYALLKAAKEAGVSKVFIHFFGDGRDTDPKSGAAYMEELLSTAQEIGIGQIATVVGRYYAMDRDKRWERNELALKGLILGEGEQSDDPVKTVKERYEKGENDEFLKPIIVGGDEGRIKGEKKGCVLFLAGSDADSFQTATTSSSSTTGLTVSGKSPSSWAMSTGRPCPTSPTPRSTWSP